MGDGQVSDEMLDYRTEKYRAALSASGSDDLPDPGSAYYFSVWGSLLGMMDSKYHNYTFKQFSELNLMMRNWIFDSYDAGRFFRRCERIGNNNVMGNLHLDLPARGV